MDHRNASGLPRILSCIALFHTTLTLTTPTRADDLVQEAVNKVSLGQYKTYQIDIESMGLGLYGGPDYDQGYRNRDGWLSGGTLGNAETCLYLTDQFMAMGLETTVQGDYANVVAEMPGIARPRDVYVVCGHYDSTSNGERPGGDDNASGTAGVLEAARVLTQYHADATLRFIGFNAEEDWMLGSEDYVANVLAPSYDNVIGVVNLDMILRPAWDSDPQADIDLDIATGDLPICLAWVNTFVATAAHYTPSLVIDAGTPETMYWYASDQGPFVSSGYAAIMLSEGTATEIWSGSNTYYHSSEDASDGLANDPASPSGVTYDYGFAADVVRATVATLAEQAGLVSRPLASFGACQSIATDAVRDLEFFTLGGESYLAAAQEANAVTANVASTLYRWGTDGFAEHQAIPTSGACDWEFFSIAGEAYLAVANATDDATYQVDSKVYRWNGDRFIEHQSLPTLGARDCAFFTVAGEAYLAVANARDDTTADVNSTIYKWTGTQFDPFQSIPTHGASDCEIFTIEGETFLAVANAGDGRTQDVDSVIYQWSETGFSEFQAIATFGAADWESFVIDGTAYLAVANAGHGAPSEMDSRLYKWDGGGFALLQSVPTYGAADWEFFVVDEVPHLAIANANDGNDPDGNSRIYTWNGMRFVESQAIPGSQAREAAFFTVDGTGYLGLAQVGAEEAHAGFLKLYRYR